MYPRFIEVHDADTDMLISINVDKITSICDEGISTEREGYDVRESYEEIMTMIRDTGCLIHKADPRLDSQPLTWDDLQETMMIGQPVWSKTKRCWYLVVDTSLDSRSWVELVDACGKQFRIIEHDLKDYQLARKEEK